MKATCKRFLSLVLTISMLCSGIPALAFESDDISINLTDEAPLKYDIDLPEELPQIKITDDDMLPIMSGVSRYNTVDVDRSGLYTGKPSIQMPIDNTLVIPDNRMELDAGGRVQMKLTWRIWQR